MRVLVTMDRGSIEIEGAKTVTADNSGAFPFSFAPGGEKRFSIPGGLEVITDNITITIDGRRPIADFIEKAKQDGTTKEADEKGVQGKEEAQK